MTSRRSREAAFSDLVGGLLDARNDPATERFDAELSAAQDQGRIDPQTAKLLRWWQREAQRALVEHAQTVLPPTLLALEQAAAGAHREAAASASSWARASAEEPFDGPVGGRRSTSAFAPGHLSAPVGYPSGSSSHTRQQGRSPADSGTGAGPAADLAADMGANLGMDEAGSDRPDDGPLTPPADLSEHRRRLLVAGLTRVRHP